MPELVTYKGRPVKRRERMGQSIKLIFVHPQEGKTGEVRFVSQADWTLHGAVQFFTKEEMPNVRLLARH
jgi:hypothetical protein